MGDRLVKIPFGRQTYVARSTFVYGERLQNWYAEKNPQGAKGAVTLQPTPGLTLWTTVGSGIFRGMRRLGQDLYVVYGDEIFVITETKAATRLGTPIQKIKGVGDVQLSDNGTHVFITTSTMEAYAINRTDFITLAEGDFNDVTYQDGFVFFTRRGTQQIFNSKLDSTVVSGLDFTAKDAQTDNVVGVISDHREVIGFGEKTSEIYFNAGSSPSPLARVQNGFIERGLLAAGSVQKTRNNVFWLADDKRVYAMQGYQPVPVSTTGIDNLIADQPNPEFVDSFIYTQKGHEFYVLNMQKGSFVFDVSEGLWHERKSLNEDRWRAKGHANIFNKQLVADIDNNNIYELDLNNFTDNGDMIIRQSEFPVVDGGGHRLFFAEMFLDFESGQGLVTGQGSDPVVIIDWSDDGGKTLSNRLEVPIGKIGEYNARAAVSRLGTAYHRRFRVTVTDPVNAVLSDASVRVEARL